MRIHLSDGSFFILHAEVFALRDPAAGDCSIESRHLAGSRALGAGLCALQRSAPLVPRRADPPGARAEARVARLQRRRPCGTPSAA